MELRGTSWLPRVGALTQDLGDPRPTLLSLSGLAAVGYAHLSSPHTAQGSRAAHGWAMGIFKRVWDWRGEPGPPESRRVSSLQSCPSHVEQPQLLVPLGCRTEEPAA